MRFLQTLSPSPPVDREEYIIKNVHGRTALHLGCVDAGMLEERILTRTLLHERLHGVAQELWGLDIDEAGVRVLASRGFTRVHCGSAEEPPPTIPRAYFDVIVAGEIIEHVRNVGLFLDAAASLLRPGGHLIITTPNALRFYNPVPAAMGFELVHPDHLSWFSPHTLVQAIERAPLSVEAVYSYANAPHLRVDREMPLLKKIPRRAANALFAIAHGVFVRLSPHWGDGLIVSARLAENMGSNGSAHIKNG